MTETAPPFLSAADSKRSAEAQAAPGGMGCLRVLVLGGYGFFGQRLVARLARQQGLAIIAAGRSAEKGEALARTLAAGAASPVHGAVLDASSPDFAQALAALAPHVVIHTAGPFQEQGYGVARACIAAGAHYIDLADGRAFVQGITVLDAEARAAGVAVIAGASSVPALSSAVADELCAGMDAVRSIDIGISPGNRTERGLSTVQAVLSYCGRPIDMQGPRQVFGWSGNWAHVYPYPVGRRLLSPCDVPDLALLPSRYPGQPQVRFGAGLELHLLHRGMNALAWLARRGWVRGWERHAAWLKAASDWFRRRGTDAGGMHVAVRGSAGDAEVVRRWELLATHGDGPFVPTLAAAALVARIAAGRAPDAGARACVGLLTPQEILAQARGLSIAAGECAARGVFRRAMGPAYQRLDMAVRAFHELRGRAELHGEVETEAPATRLGLLLARTLGAPRVRARGPLRFELHCEDGSETWTRHFPARTMRSRLSLHGAGVVETLGPARLVFALEEQGGALVMVLRGMRFLGVPCPRWLLPRVEARETGRDGRLNFDVTAALPVVGRVAAYRGWLALPGSA